MYTNPILSLRKTTTKFDRIKIDGNNNILYKMCHNFWFFFFFCNENRSLAIGNNPFLLPNDLMTIVLHCDKLDSLHLYRMEKNFDGVIKLILCSSGLKDRLKALTLDWVSLNPISYEVNKYLNFESKLYIYSR